MWAIGELGLAYERIDLGLEFGGNDIPAYLAMNPTGLMPTLIDGDFILWESNSIVRYLANRYG
jgi:glutathione S-transferase